MPGPNPFDLWIEETDEGKKLSYYCYFWSGKLGHRKQRADVLIKRIRSGDWDCKHCDRPIPIFRRADALYCGLSCKQKAGRKRRAKTAKWSSKPAYI